MEPLALHIGGASKIGLPLPPAQGPIISPSAGLALPDAPRDASDDEIGVDDLLGFGGADANAAKRSLAFNAGKYDEAVRSIAALGRDPVKRDGVRCRNAVEPDVDDEIGFGAVVRVEMLRRVGRLNGAKPNGVEPEHRVTGLDKLGRGLDRDVNVLKDEAFFAVSVVLLVKFRPKRLGIKVRGEHFANALHAANVEARQATP